MVYEVQSYLLVVDVNAFEIVQSYPIRILSIGNEAGKRTPIQIKRDLKRKMWRSLSRGDDKKTGSRRIPGELRRVKLTYRCSTCGTELRMTLANDSLPQAPRHCSDEMDLTTPLEDL